MKTLTAPFVPVLPGLAKRCPFCGGTRLVIYTSVTGRVCVACDDEASECAAVGPAKRDVMAAIEAWNDRGHPARAATTRKAWGGSSEPGGDR
jgi:Lar family restriction alleviation protein